METPGIATDALSTNGVQNKENVCTSTAPVEVTVAAIRRQCEFYFSDSNILKDQYMLNQVKASNDGWVKLGLIEKFKRMQSLTQDHDTVVRALASSETLELSEDGLRVRRRAPLPDWDPSVYNRTIIISDLPGGTELTNASLMDFFSTKCSTPLLVRLFTPNKKLPTDLRRSQGIHPQLGTKLCAVIEFQDRTSASKAMSVARRRWSDAYVHLLSFGSKKANEANAKKVIKKKDSKDLGVALSTAGYRPLNLKQPNEANKIIHVREPLKPPTENTVGFAPGWRELIRLERLLPPSIGGTDMPQTPSFDPAVVTSCVAMG